MLTRRVIPCLDVRDGRVVKGVKFRDLRESGAPADRASLYEAEGADEIVMLDVSATSESRAASVGIVRAVRRVLSIPLTVGGGIRTAADASRLLDVGADKVALNTAAFIDPGLVTTLATRFGSQCVTASIDAARSERGWKVVVRAGTEQTETSVVEWAAEVASRGAGEILLTSVDRDGTQSGYDTDLLTAVAGRVRVPVVASGGARTADHLIAAIQAGADAVLAASILHDGLTTVMKLKSGLAAAGIMVRQ
jgi:cyclase